MYVPDPIKPIELSLPGGGVRTFHAPQSMVNDVRQILADGAYRIQPPEGWRPEIIVDIGANCGAFTMFAHLSYPGSRILSFEPSQDNFELLERNTSGLPGVEVHHCGLFDKDEERTLYYGSLNAGQASIHARANQQAMGQQIQLRRASTTLASLGVERISILKIDTEGCELPILRDLGPLVAASDFVLLEYHLEDDRRAIDALLADDFYLVGARVHVPHCGELKFVRKAVLHQNADFAAYCKAQEG